MRFLLYFSALAGLAAFLFDDRSAFGRGVRRVCFVWIAFGFLYSLPGLRRTFGWQAEFRKTAWLLAAVMAFLWIVRWLVRRIPEVEDWADPAEPYSLEFGSGPHVAGGAHAIEGAVCPNCSIPLVRLLMFDASDARLHLGGVPVHLLFCVSCRIARGGVFSYRIEEANRVEVLEWEHDEAGSAYDLVPVQRVDLRRGVEGEHRVGGRPEWLAEGLTCPSCNGPMPFLAALGLGESRVVYHLCRTCRVVTSYSLTA